MDYNDFFPSNIPSFEPRAGQREQRAKLCEQNIILKFAQQKNVYRWLRSRRLFRSWGRRGWWGGFRSRGLGLIAVLVVPLLAVSRGLNLQSQWKLAIEQIEVKFLNERKSTWEGAAAGAG